ncbi:hypothetical protein BJX99DRAFT_255246 [Aspergillus californicus]
MSSLIPYTDLAFTTSRPQTFPAKVGLLQSVGYSIARANLALPPPERTVIFSAIFTCFTIYSIRLVSDTPPDSFSRPIGHANSSICLATHSASQTWLTAESPEGLVRKYTEFAHGSRIVLDQTRLPGITAAGNVRVVPSNILLEGFAKTVQEQAQIAKERSETLLILIFAHGLTGTGKICLGGNPISGDPHELSMEGLKRMLPRDYLKITLIMTSCYSGSWLVLPSVNHRTHLNLTGPGGQTRSWSLSKSLGRACGTSVASAIIQTIVEVEQIDDIFQHLTYLGLSAAIYDKAVSLDRFIDEQKIYFSAQDDEWESHWAKRTGLPLVRYQDRWEELRIIPPMESSEAGETPIQSSRRVASAHHEFEIRATQYLDAKPGSSSRAGNVGLQGQINNLREGTLRYAHENTEFRGVLEKLKVAFH